MAIRTESFNEGKFLDGKSFSYITSELALAAGADLNLVLCVGNEPAIIRFIKLTSDADSLSWQVFAGVDHVAGSGVNVPAIKRNSLADTHSIVTLEKGSTINSVGLPVFDPASEVIGQSAAGNRSYIDVDLLTDLFTATANICLLLRITNNDSGPKRVNINAESYNN